MTSDESVLEIALDCHIDFIQPVTKQEKYPFQKFNKFEENIIDKEIQKLLEMGVIEEAEFVEDQFISPIFVIPKKDGEYRMILNLKELNKFVEYSHFKMDTFETALKMVKPNCFMASIDLRHAYYSVNIYKPHRRYLRFVWKHKIFEFTCLPFGLALAPRKFTKLMKPVYAKLRQMGYLNSGYIDDSFLLGDTRQECECNVLDTVSVMTDLGFIKHESKSVMIPVQNLVFLGNHIDSQRMIVYLTDSRKCVLTEECKKLRKRHSAKIREVARVVGLMVAAFSAVEFGPLFYRELEKAKIGALSQNCGKFDADMHLTDKMHIELDWWIENVPTSYRKISHGSPQMKVVTDASLSGWGARCKDEKNDGRWTLEEANYHINALELLAIFYALKSFCKFVSGIHVQVMTDNTCALSYIKNFGGVKSEICNNIAKELWIWAISKDIWISVAYIPGPDNAADYESRNHNDNIEWMLDSSIAQNILNIWDKPVVDMFASRLNKQLPRYVAWKPDPEAEFIDAFSLSWTDLYFYAFPPFSLIPRLMMKLREEEAECVLVAPIWMTQTWFVTVMEQLIEDPYILPVHQTTLTLPGTQKIHPLYKRLTLMVCRLSGKLYKVKAYQKELRPSLCLLGDMEPRNSTPCILKNGLTTVVKGRLVVFKFL